MSTRLLAVLCVAVCAAAGCRMADGPMPMPGPEDLNRLEDLRHDVGNVVAGHAEAKQDFVDDLLVFVKADTKPEAPAAISELARLVAGQPPSANAPADYAFGFFPSLVTVTDATVSAAHQVFTP